MTTRYKTEGEKAGVKRRMAALRKRKIEDGLKQYAFWLTEEGAQKVKEFIATLPDNKQADTTKLLKSEMEKEKN